MELLVHQGESALSDLDNLCLVDWMTLELTDTEVHAAGNADADTR